MLYWGVFVKKTLGLFSLNKEPKILSTFDDLWKHVKIMH